MINVEITSNRALFHHLKLGNFKLIEEIIIAIIYPRFHQNTAIPFKVPKIIPNTPHTDRFINKKL